MFGIKKRRHLLVDTLGLLLHAIVHPADIQDRDGGILLLATLFGMYPFLKKLFADGGYQGPDFQKALAKILPHLTTEIVKRSDHAKGFSSIALIATGMSTLKSKPVEQNSNGSGLGGCVSFGHTAPANHSGTLARLASAITGP